MRVEFVVGSLLCSERFFSEFSGFPLSSKTNISKFQFDQDVRHLSHEPLARVIAQALPVLDVKFTFTVLHYIDIESGLDFPSRPASRCTNIECFLKPIFIHGSEKKCSKEVVRNVVSAT